MTFRWETAKERQKRKRGEQEAAEAMADFVRHVICNGSRQHVVSYIGTDKGVIRRCSHPSCEINREPKP